MINFKGFFISNLFKFSTVLAFNQGLNFLLIFIYLKTIDTATYGTIGLLQSYAILIGVVSMLGIRDGFYVLYYKVNKNTLYSNFFLFFLFMVLLVTLVAIVFKDFFIISLSIPIEFYSLIFIYALSNALYANFEITMRLENWNNLYLYIALIRGILVFLSKLYFVLHFENSIEFIRNILLTDIISYILISMTLFIIINIKVLKFNYQIDFSLYPRLFKVGLPFLASNGSGWVFNGLDRVLIERFFSLEILGVYLYGIKIAAAIGNMIHQVLNLLYAPKALKLLSEDKVSEMEELGYKISNWLVGLNISAILFTFFVYFSLVYFNISDAKMIALFFLGAFLVEVAKIVPRINGQKLLFLEKSHILSLFYMLSSIIILFLYYIFLPIAGLGVIFLAQLLVYFLITHYMHQYILKKTTYSIVNISSIFWLFTSIIILILLLYFSNIKGVM